MGSLPRRLLLGLVVVGLGVAIPRPSAASFCLGNTHHLIYACGHSTFAFTGVVVETTHPPQTGPYTVRVRVVRSVRGNVPSEVELQMGAYCPTTEGSVCIMSSADVDEYSPGTIISVFLEDSEQRAVTLCTFREELDDEAEAELDPCRPERLAETREAFRARGMVEVSDGYFESRRQPESDESATDPGLGHDPVAIAPSSGGCATCSAAADHRSTNGLTLFILAFLVSRSRRWRCDRR